MSDIPAFIQSETPAEEVAPTGDNSQTVLRGFVERVERLEEEKKALAEDIKAVMAEAKAAGFDNKTIRKVLKVRQDPEKFQEEEQLLSAYLAAFGIEF